MASVYEKKDSPFWYASIWDAAVQGWKNAKTPCRRDSPAGKRNALIWAAAQERVAVSERPLLKAEAWAVWVEPWVRQSYGYNRNTMQRYLNCWWPLNEFLAEREILIPRHLKRTHAFDYMNWRTAQKRRRGSAINHNTALTELKVLSRIMQEALLRGLCDGNPLMRLGIRRQNVQHTPRMFDEDIARAREALKRYPEWMKVCFEIALHHGCRLTETKVPMDRIHLDPATNHKVGLNLDRITFECKGRNGERKISTVPLHSALRPIMVELKKRGARYTCDLPRMAAKEWWKFRRDNGLEHLRFHSTRATVASILAEQGVSKQTAMSILVHANETVHQAYLHLTAKPVGDAIAKIAYAGDGELNEIENRGVPNAKPESVPESKGDRKRGSRAGRE